MTFLNDFFNENPKKRPDGDSKYTIAHDRWDMEDYQRIHNEVKDFSVAEKDLAGIAGDTAAAAMADEFFSLVKAIPQLKNSKEVRPSHLINQMVMDEQMKLPQYQSLRAHSVGDPIGTALSAVSMEPHLEVIYDKLKKEQELAQELEQQMQQYEQLMEEQQSVEDMLNDAMQNGNSEQAQDFQQQQQLIQQQMDQLKESIQNGAQGLQDALEGKAGTVRSTMSKALNEALNEAEKADSMGTAWGLDSGTLNRMPAQKRIELANKLKTPKFQRLAELIGPMMRMAWAEQARKVNRVPEELFDVEYGNDLAHMLPTEYLYLNTPALRVDWMRRFVDRSLLQYKLRGNDRVAKGGIIFCEDGSGSMHGEREIWAKAVGLALLHIAKQQNRPFTGLHFGGSKELMSFDFNTDSKDKHFEVVTQGTYQHEPETLTGVDAVISFAEIFFGGGTDFVTPLSAALDRLQEQHSAQGAVNGDIVFVTDGSCGVHPDWLAQFKAEQEKLGFRVFGVVIGGSLNSEPLNTICDGKVVTVTDLVTGGDVASIFGEI